jgi:hypothetical protein
MLCEPVSLRVTIGVSGVVMHSSGEIPITTSVVNLNSSHAAKCTRYVIMFVSDIWQVGCVLLLLLFHAPIKLTAIIWLKYC